jgi:two-component system, LytTR family, sensor kinase
MTGPRRFAILAAALLIPSLVLGAQLYAGYRLRGMSVSFAAAFLIQAMHWELWAIAGPVVWDLERRWPIATLRGDTLLRHAAGACAVATAVLSAYFILYHAVVRAPGIASWFANFDRGFSATAIFFVVAYFYVELLVYVAIVAAARAVRTDTLLRAKERDALRLESELTAARLTTLRTQLQPHFLFNTLHTIGSLILQRQHDQAVGLLAELGELLRGTLSHRDTDLAPLKDEVAYLQRYLRIEEARFSDRLQIEWSLDPAAMDALIPPFILQPLVENAFRHGIARCEERAVLRIGAAAANGSVRITVENDGPRLADTFAIDECRGYGLKNVVERLRTRNPSGHLELANAPSGVRAIIVVPLWAAANARHAS